LPLHGTYKKQAIQETQAFIGNESVPKIIINDTINIFIKLHAVSILVISNDNSFRVLFDKIAALYFTGKNILTF